jgi:hypothetical protein
VGRGGGGAQSVRGRRRGMLGRKGGGREVGHGWAERGRERGASDGPETENGWIKSFRIFIWNLDF